MILADTSMWAQHFRTHDSRFASLLELDSIVLHDFVIGELACGNLRDRPRTLSALSSLRRTVVATNDDALGLLERHRLWGIGIGLVDLHLIASSLIDNLELLTLDNRLKAAATRAGAAVVALG